MLKLESSIWLGVKYLRMTWLRVRFALLTLSSVTANFTLIVGMLAGDGFPLIIVPLSLIIAVAFTATILHSVKWSSQEIGLLKALGARKATLTCAILLQLAVLGVSSALLGVLMGLGLTLYVAGPSILPETFTLTLPVSLAVALLAAGLGAASVWTKSGQTVVEFLHHAG